MNTVFPVQQAERETEFMIWKFLPKRDFWAL